MSKLKNASLCAKDYLLHVQTREHNFVYHSCPCACIECGVVWHSSFEMPVYSLLTSRTMHIGPWNVSVYLLQGNNSDALQ